MFFQNIRVDGNVGARTPVKTARYPGGGVTASRKATPVSDAAEPGEL